MDFESEQVTTILKWIGIVFASGFIGYFGRHLSTIIINRLRRDKKEGQPVKAPHAVNGESNAVELEKARLKLEKKRLKMEEKERKKRDDA